MNKGTVTLVGLAALAFVACKTEPAARPEPTAPVDIATADPATLVRNGRMPMDGLLTGGQPTDEQLAVLAEAGFRTVINLRQPDERGTVGEAEKVAQLGMTYVALPIGGVDDLSEENAIALAAALDEAARPALLHCGSGNRVGALLALKALWLDGAGAEEAMEVGRQAGLTRLEPAVRKLVEAAE